MKDDILTELIGKTDLLTPEQQLRFAGILVEKVRTSSLSEAESRRKWSDLRGMLTCPGCGEDAQEYISRSRKVSDWSLWSRIRQTHKQPFETIRDGVSEDVDALISR